MSLTVFDEYFKFPEDTWTTKSFNKLIEFCGSAEEAETNFKIKFSRIEGRINLKIPPVDKVTKSVLCPVREHRLTIDHFEEKIVFCLNGKERTCKNVLIKK